MNIEDHITPVNATEQEIINDPEFQEGVQHGKPRPGHPEGKVLAHIVEVLNNINALYDGSKINKELYENLRFIALIHDTFKNKVDRKKPKNGDNHHAVIAKNFAKKFTDDKRLLSIIENHDEPYNAYNLGAKKDKWHEAEKRVNVLIKQIEPFIELFFIFYKCDNATGDKSDDDVIWFLDQCNNNGLDIEFKYE